MVFGIKTDSDRHAVKWEIRNKKREVKEVKRVGGEGQDPNPPTLGPICRRGGTKTLRTCKTGLNFLNTSCWSILTL